MEYMLCWHANIFSEAARVDVRAFESGAHGIIAVAAVMTGTTWHMMRHDHTLPDREIGHSFSALNYGASQLMSQYDRGSGFLHDFDDVRTTQPTAMHFDQQFMVGNGWN
jgi:hypothetical protein